MSSIKELKAQRETLWEELHALKAQYDPEEKRIRDQIRAINNTLYPMEMAPIVARLEHKASEGKASEAEIKKLDMVKSHIKKLKGGAAA